MYLLGILVFSLSFVIFIYLSKEPMGSNIVSLIKYLYFIILLILIDSKDLKISKRNLFYIALIYILLIFVPRMLSFDFNSYREGNIGSVGIFNSGNEINAILVFLLPVYLTNLLKEQSLAYRLIFFAVYGCIPSYACYQTFHTLGIYLNRFFPFPNRNKSICNTLFDVFLTINENSTYNCFYI